MRSLASIDEVDQVVTVRTDWTGLERFLELKGESKHPRITYLRGILELMSPSADHEALATRLGRLLEMWASATGTRLTGYGSWTVTGKGEDAAVEPDECYVVNRVEPGKRPDLAIEVNWSHGGTRKLDVYHPLGVPEVWMWEDGKLSVWVRRPKNYVRAARSQLLPKLDLNLLSKLSLLADQNRASTALLKALGLKFSR